jgi:predicted GNAT superfamily acetyltransferase
MKSHWANYKKEKENALVYEDENGFFSAVEFEDWFYCDEVYVVREKRDKGVMKAYEKKFIEEAKERGFKKVLGSVCISTNNCERNLLIYLKSGWKILNIDKTLIYFEKEI